MKEQEATAGFRNAGWTMGQLPHGSAVSVHPLSTADGAAVNGLLYTNGRSDVVAFTATRSSGRSTVSAIR